MAPAVELTIQSLEVRGADIFKCVFVAERQRPVELCGPRPR